MKSCPICCARKPAKRDAPLAPAERVGKPFERIGIDFMKLTTSRNGNTHVAVAVDHASKWVEAQACAGETAEAAARLIFEEVVCRHGFPKEVWSDRGAVFSSEVVKELSAKCGFKQCMTSGYHPETNGLVERMNRTLADILAKISPTQQEWDEHLREAVWAYNTSEHSATRFSPFEILHGVPASQPADKMLPSAEKPRRPNELVKETKENTERVQAEALANQTGVALEQKKQHDKRARDVQFNVGDKVLWFRAKQPRGDTTKLALLWKGPFIIAEKLNAVNYRLQDENGQAIPGIAHAQDLKEVVERENERFEGGEL